VPYTWLTEDPEARLVITPAYAAICRTFPDIPEDARQDVAAQLAKSLYYSSLRHTPLALRAVREWGGSGMEMKALEYLARVGFPEDHPVPAPARGSLRKTPREVRALWKPCKEAVDETFHELPKEVHQTLCLNLSWHYHLQAMHRKPWYRDMVRGMYYVAAMLAGWLHEDALVQVVQGV
jgi:hypothetical protein